MVAEANMPSDPVITADSSDKISPNRFSVRITSKGRGSVTKCMAQESTYMCSSLTSVYSRATRLTTSRQSCEVSSTLALSTDVSCDVDGGIPGRQCGQCAQFLLSNSAWY